MKKLCTTFEYRFTNDGTRFFCVAGTKIVNRFLSSGFLRFGLRCLYRSWQLFLHSLLHSRFIANLNYLFFSSWLYHALLLCSCWKYLLYYYTDMIVYLIWDIWSSLNFLFVYNIYILLLLFLSYAYLFLWSLHHKISNPTK